MPGLRHCQGDLRGVHTSAVPAEPSRQRQRAESNAFAKGIVCGASQGQRLPRSRWAEFLPAAPITAGVPRAVPAPPTPALPLGWGIPPFPVLPAPFGHVRSKREHRRRRRRQPVGGRSRGLGNVPALPSRNCLSLQQGTAVICKAGSWHTLKINNLLS